jgi:hypothetical protein
VNVVLPLKPRAGVNVNSPVAALNAVRLPSAEGTGTVTALQLSVQPVAGGPSLLRIDSDTTTTRGVL